MADHQTTKDTEKRSYDRLRDAGIGHDNARKIAREAAEQTSRAVDKRR